MRISNLSRRSFLRKAGAFAAAAPLLLNTSAFAQAAPLPEGSGKPGRRMLIKGATVLSMDAAIGDFSRADILIVGDKIEQIGPDTIADDAAVIDAEGMIVVPGFIDTHHHLFQTALRSTLSDKLLFNDGLPENALNYIETMVFGFTPHYRPEDVYISEKFGSLSQLDAGVTSVLDTSQINHTPEHTDAAISGLLDAGQRASFGYLAGSLGDARRIRTQYFSSSDQLMGLVIGAEAQSPTFAEEWALARELGLPIASHVVGTFGLQEAFGKLAAQGQFGPDNILIHMTGMSDEIWAAARDAGSSISLAVPIEMTMRHGIPPVMKLQEFGMRTSLSTDVESTMTADFFTQMRGIMTLQRALANEMAISGAADVPKLFTARDVLEFATVEGARALHTIDKVGTLTPGKQADLVLLDAAAINVAPLNNAAGAVVTLMDRSNVDTVLVAGKIRKWRGELVDVNVPKLRQEIEASRDYLLDASKFEQNILRR